MEPAVSQVDEPFTYAISPSVAAQIERTFTYHPPKPGQPERYIAIRDKAKELALLIASTTPASREQSRALSSLEDVVTSANGAIARNE